MPVDYWGQFQPVSGGSLATGVSNTGQPIYGTPAPVNRVGTDPNRLYPAGSPTQPALPTQQPQTVASTGGTAAGDPQATFMQIMGGLPATPQNLAAKEQELAAAGIYVHRNAEGVAGKVQLGQNGPIVDVIANAGLGGGGQWQWLTGGGGGNIPGFEVGMFTGGGQYPLSSVMGTGLSAPWTTPFNAPTDITMQNDPGFQARLKMGTDALQQSAAARGTLLTGGLLKSLDRYAQDYASNEYGNVYNRALGEYQMAHNIFEENQGNLFSRLGYLGSIGENAAAGVGNAQIGLGNAQGQGSIAQGNIWGNAAAGAGTLAGNLFTNLNRPPNPNIYATSYGPSYTGTTAGYGQYYPPGTFTP